jgi:hypothetical protein
MLAKSHVLTRPLPFLFSVVIAVIFRQSQKPAPPPPAPYEWPPNPELPREGAAIGGGGGAAFGGGGLFGAPAAPINFGAPGVPLFGAPAPGAPLFGGLPPAPPAPAVVPPPAAPAAAIPAKPSSTGILNPVILFLAAFTALFAYLASKEGVPTAPATLPDDPLPSLRDSIVLGLGFVFSFFKYVFDALSISELLESTHTHLDWVAICVCAPPLAVLSLLSPESRPTTAYGSTDLVASLLLTSFLCFLALSQYANWGTVACCVRQKIPVNIEGVARPVAAAERKVAPWRPWSPTPTHFVFVLDHSDSMKRSNWAILKQALVQTHGKFDNDDDNTNPPPPLYSLPVYSNSFAAFTSQRSDAQKQVDFSSIIYFSDPKASVGYDFSTAYGAVADWDEDKNGSTDFSLGLRLALAQLKKTPAGVEVHLVFLSDGEDNRDGTARRAVLTEIRDWALQRKGGVISNLNTTWSTVAFGNAAANTAGLVDIREYLKDVGKVKEYHVPDAVGADIAQLSVTFADVAKTESDGWALWQFYMGSLARPLGLWLCAILIAIRFVFPGSTLLVVALFFLIRLVVYIFDTDTLSKFVDRYLILH